MEEALFDQLYKRLVTMACTKKITTTNILVTVGLATQLVQTAKLGGTALTNEKKKKLVMDMISKLISELELEGEDQKYLVEIFVPQILGGAVDSLCALDVQKVSKKFFDWLFSCCH